MDNIVLVFVPRGKKAGILWYLLLTVLSVAFMIPWQVLYNYMTAVLLFTEYSSLTVCTVHSTHTGVSMQADHFHRAILDCFKFVISL